MTINLTDHKKIVIIGISGVGKSRFSRILAAATGLPLYHMDSIIWRENWTEADDDAIQQTLDNICQMDEWILEGWIDHYSYAILTLADAVIYLDFPGWLALWGALQRWITYRCRPRPELPTGCLDTWDWGYLYVIYKRLERPHVEAILAESVYTPIVRVTSRGAANQLLHRQ